MTRGKTDLSFKEANESINDIVGIVLTANNEELRDNFKRSSRATQSGYDITMYLLKKGLIRLGDPQEKMKV